MLFIGCQTPLACSEPSRPHRQSVNSAPKNFFFVLKDLIVIMHVYVKLMIDGVVSRGFSGETEK
jgi:hypothetical protein